MDGITPLPPLGELAGTDGVKPPEVVSSQIGDDKIIASPQSGKTVAEIIPDRYLYQTVGACCTDDRGHFQLSKAVKQLINRYAPADRPTMNAIPQDQRRQFLNELAAITGRTLPAYEPIRVEPTFADQDATLIDNGYEPIAVNGKIPVTKGWNTRLNTIDCIAAERADHPGANSTGLRTGRLVGVDIDIVPADHVQAIKALAVEVLGDTSLERVGAKGAMLCYRNETPVKKITISGGHPTQAGKVEILGTGQQFVSYGVHPDTGKPYTWTNSSSDGDPLHTPLDKLPEVTPDKLREFADRASALMAEQGYTDVKVSGRGRSTEPKHLDAPVGGKFDAPIDLERGRTNLRSLIDRGEVAIEGQGGDDRTFKIACHLRGLGLSPQSALELLLEPNGWNEHCRPPWSHDELALKVHNAYRYGKGAPGAFSFPSEFLRPDAIGAPAAAQRAVPTAAPTEVPTAAPADPLVERFRGRWPDEYEALPELEFWDEDRTLPRSPDGCIGIVYGEFGSHKTNTVLTMVLDAVLDQRARVCYAAGEGAHGVGKHRIPAHCRARGVMTKDLRERLRIVPAVPLFASPEQVAAFISAQQDFNPNIVVLDTLATAIAGEDENSSRAASFLTANGPAGRIRNAFRALVILPAHQGKDAGKRVRGHSGFMGNADVVLHVEADKPAGKIKVTVEKMRDGRDGFSIFFKVQTGPGVVPVPEKITQEEYLGLAGTITDQSDDSRRIFDNRRGVLRDQQALNFEAGLSEKQFAELLVGERPRDRDEEALTDWKAAVEREKTALKNAHSKPSYKGVLCDNQIPAGSDKSQWRWFIVKPETSDTQAGLGAPRDAAAVFGQVHHGGGLQWPDGASATGYPS
jgi:hypothetical protein